MTDLRAQSIRDASYGYTSELLPTAFRDVLRDFGDQKIVEASIHKKPIASINFKFANWLSLGKLERKRKEMGYDAYNHVWLNLKTEDGTWISTDKVQHLSAKASRKAPPLGVGKQVINIDVGNKTFRQMVNGAVEKAGSHRELATYDPIGRNCQNYLFSLVGGQMTPNQKTWLKEEADLSAVARGAVKKVVKVGEIISPDQDLDKLQRESDLRLGIDIRKKR